MKVILMMRGRPLQSPGHACCHGNPMTLVKVFTKESFSGRFTIFGHRGTCNRLCCCRRQPELNGHRPVPSILVRVPMATPATDPPTQRKLVDHLSLILTPPTRLVTMETPVNTAMCVVPQTSYYRKWSKPCNSLTKKALDMLLRATISGTKRRFLLTGPSQVSCYC